jgi:hypothetical protein
MMASSLREEAISRPLNTPDNGLRESMVLRNYNKLFVKIKRSAIWSSSFLQTSLCQIVRGIEQAVHMGNFSGKGNISL